MNKWSESKRVFLRRCIAVVVFMIAIPQAFQRLDGAHVVPQRLKRLIEVIEVDTEVDEDWYKARVRLWNRGLQPHDVNATLFWLDGSGYEIGVNRSKFYISPGDTVNIRLSMKAPEGQTATNHRLEYQVSRVDF